VEVARLLVVPNTRIPANVVLKLAACGMRTSSDGDNDDWTAMGIHLPSQTELLYDSTGVLQVELEVPNIFIPSARIVGDMTSALYQRDATEDTTIDIEAHHVVSDPLTGATAKASLVCFKPVDGTSAAAQRQQVSPGTSSYSTVFTSTPRQQAAFRALWSNSLSGVSNTLPVYCQLWMMTAGVTCCYAHQPGCTVLEHSQECSTFAVYV